jgi:predicted RNA binding protein YcfA (HicA-like mRNA interferase family)
MTSEGKLPNQLPWRDFVRVLKQLGYDLFESKPGSARVFFCPTRSPDLVVFHEPHGKEPLREGTLPEYLRKLQISREQFLQILKSR